MDEKVSWYSRRWLATGTPRSQTPDDEERLLPGREPSPGTSSSSRKRPRKCLSFPRPKVMAYLVLIDLIIIGTLVFITNPLITLLRRNDELFPTRASLSRPDIPAGSWPQRKIPRILHQTCANDTIPEKWVNSQRSCKEAYSEYEYKLWTDDTARELIAAEYPWFLPNWDGYAFPIQRADSIRYIVLYHYGGMYLDMDTLCNETFPLHQIENDTTPHVAVFKSTKPTGVTNDFMITSARHPVYASVIAQLPTFYKITRFWARLQPYANIMMSSGPLFLTLAVQNWLLGEPSLPSPAIQIVTPEQLSPYLSDLESATWHRSDAKVLMWLGARQWTWYAMGAIGIVVGSFIVNFFLLLAWRPIRRRLQPSLAYAVKLAKVS